MGIFGISVGNEQNVLGKEQNSRKDRSKGVSSQVVLL